MRSALPPEETGAPETVCGAEVVEEVIGTGAVVRLGVVSAGGFISCCDACEKYAIAIMKPTTPARKTAPPMIEPKSAFSFYFFFVFFGAGLRVGPCFLPGGL